MPADSVRVSRSLLLAALDDAIDYCESYLDATAGTPEYGTATRKRLAAYRGKYAELTGSGLTRLEAGTTGTPVLVSDLLKAADDDR